VIESQPLVSLIVVNWNGEKYLPRCLDGIFSQSYPESEVILIDNASSDHSADDLEIRWPGLQVVRLEKNIGFAAANNMGAHIAHGRWLALINNDAFISPSWLEEMLKAAQENEDYAFFASRIIQVGDSDRIDGTGDIYHVSGLAWHRQYNQPSKQAILVPDEVFSPCAAAALYDRRSFLEAGGFDEDFISHHEDVDLGFRLRLRGLRCMYVPEAIVEHVGSASYGKESHETIYRVHRNLVWSYFTNMPGVLFWKYLPAHLLANLVFLLYYSLRSLGKAIWRAKLDALRGLPNSLRKRKMVQRTRNVEIKTIDQMMDHGWISPYILGRHSKNLRKAIGLPSSDLE
jgi:GT2 family glycosyltransferase